MKKTTVFDPHDLLDHDEDHGQLSQKLFDYDEDHRLLIHKLLAHDEDNS
jgi:hypothetical protein